MNVPRLRFKDFSGNWEIKNLGCIAEVYDGTHQTPEYVEKGVKFVSVENINDLSNTSKFITEEAFEKEYKIKPKVGDILMTRITAGIIGTTAIINSNEPLGYYVSLALIRIRNDFNVSFLNQIINSNLFKHELHKRIIHVAFPKKINLGDISKCKVYFTSLPEQTKIANFLTAVDEKIAQLTQKADLLARYKKGVMQQIFSQQLRFKDDGAGFPDWEVKNLGEVGAIITGKTPSTTDESLWNGDIQFVTPTDITDEKYQVKTQRTVQSHTNLKVLPKNSIMFTCIASIGKMSLSINPCITNQQINSLVPKSSFNNEYVYYALLSITEYIKSTQANTTLPIINKTEFSKFEIQFPSLPEQTKIANFLAAIDDKISHNLTQLNALKQYKQGLLQQLFV